MENTNTNRDRTETHEVVFKIGGEKKYLKKLRKMRKETEKLASSMKEVGKKPDEVEVIYRPKKTEVFFLCDGEIPECRKTGCYKVMKDGCKWTSNYDHALHKTGYYTFRVWKGRLWEYSEGLRQIEETTKDESGEESVCRPLDHDRTETRKVVLKVGGEKKYLKKTRKMRKETEKLASSLEEAGKLMKPL